jgi:hypothetical protein
MAYFREHCFPLYFLRRLLEETRAQDQLLRNLSAREKLVRLNRSDLLTQDREVAYILGSGRSINEYGENQWQQIRAGYSFGMNWWLLHDFVPDVYSVELEGLMGQSPSAKEFGRVYFQLLKLRAKDYRNTTFFARGHSSFRYLLDKGVPDELRNSEMRLTLSLRLMGDTLFEVRKAVHCFGFIIRLQRRAPAWFTSFLLPGLSSSVLFLTLLAYVLGFKRVVLCGVDLVASPYFFFENLPSRRVSEGWPIPPKERDIRIHPTLDPSRVESGISVKDHLMLFRELVFARDGFEVFVGASSSGLRPEFPVYSW